MLPTEDSTSTNHSDEALSFSLKQILMRKHEKSDSNERPFITRGNNNKRYHKTRTHTHIYLWIYRSIETSRHATHAGHWTDADIVEASARLSIWEKRRERKREEKEREKRALNNWKVTSVLFCNARKQLCYVFLKQTILTWIAQEERSEREDVKAGLISSGCCLEFIWSFNEWIWYLETHERKVILFCLSRTLFFKTHSPEFICCFSWLTDSYSCLSC